MTFTLTNSNQLFTRTVPNRVRHIFVNQQNLQTEVIEAAKPSHKNEIVNESLKSIAPIAGHLLIRRADPSTISLLFLIRFIIENIEPKFRSLSHPTGYVICHCIQHMPSYKMFSNQVVRHGPEHNSCALLKNKLWPAVQVQQTSQVLDCLDAVTMK